MPMYHRQTHTQAHAELEDVYLNLTFSKALLLLLQLIFQTLAIAFLVSVYKIKVRDYM